MLVAGIDSSTQSCKVVVVDTSDGRVVRTGTARHPAGTSVHPEAWWQALKEAVAQAGGLPDVAAIGVGGQQHGMVLLDDKGVVVREALLWNDTLSANQAENLVKEFGSAWWANEIGSVPVASFTVTKLAWVAENDTASVKKSVAVCLPHDYLIYRLRGGEKLVSQQGIDNSLTTDRGDASGTGYWSTSQEKYNNELLRQVFTKDLIAPTVLGPWEQAGIVDADIATELNINPGCVLSVGSGDNMAAALGLDASAGHGIVSLGTSGTVFASSATSVHDTSGVIAGFADATGNFLPLACTLNATQVLDSFRNLLGMDYEEFDAAALSSTPGAGGLSLVPYFQGERTPNLPHATGLMHGMTLANVTPAHFARAAIEGMLCSLNDALVSIRSLGVDITNISLIGGGVASQATREIAPEIFAEDIRIPAIAEYVALGMAKQAARSIGHLIASPEGGTGIVSASPQPHVFSAYKDIASKVYPLD